jgi:hypothetical protein
LARAADISGAQQRVQVGDLVPHGARLGNRVAATGEERGTMRVSQARANAPLRPMPLVVLAHGIPFAPPSPGWPSDKMEGIMTALREDLAKLVPNAHYAIATKSGHNIHQDQPELVIAAIREVVEAVRNQSTWAPAP